MESHGCRGQAAGQKEGGGHAEGEILKGDGILHTELKGGLM